MLDVIALHCSLDSRHMKLKHSNECDQKWIVSIDLTPISFEVSNEIAYNAHYGIGSSTITTTTTTKTKTKTLAHAVRNKLTVVWWTYPIGTNQRYASSAPATTISYFYISFGAKFLNVFFFFLPILECFFWRVWEFHILTKKNKNEMKNIYDWKTIDGDKSLFVCWNQTL